MSVTLTDLRERHGAVFVTETPDGLIVPWKPLSTGDYLEYDNQFRMGFIDHSVIENEIFCKCVTDKVLVNNISLQKAGTISVVVKSIMTNSGPNSIDELNQAIDHYRGIAMQPIHQLVSVICRAFPGYTPDDIYEMDFNKMIFRLAQAENKLMSLGLMSEPIQIFLPEGEEEIKEERGRSKIDPKKIKQAFDLQESGPIDKRVKKAKEEGRKKMNLSSQKEVDDIDLGSTTPGETFIVSSNLMLTGLELGDENDARQLKRDAKELYSDYLKMGNKVKIKSVEERIKEAEERMERNKKKNLEAAKKRKKK